MGNPAFHASAESNRMSQMMHVTLIHTHQLTFTRNSALDSMTAKYVIQESQLIHRQLASDHRGCAKTHHAADHEPPLNRKCKLTALHWFHRDRMRTLTTTSNTLGIDRPSWFSREAWAASRTAFNALSDTERPIPNKSRSELYTYAHTRPPRHSHHAQGVVHTLTWPLADEM